MEQVLINENENVKIEEKVKIEEEVKIEGEGIKIEEKQEEKEKSKEEKIETKPTEIKIKEKLYSNKKTEITINFKDENSYSKEGSYLAIYKVTKEELNQYISYEYVYSKGKECNIDFYVPEGYEGEEYIFHYIEDNQKVQSSKKFKIEKSK
jgi:hypothetical protein